MDFHWLRRIGGGLAGLILSGVLLAQTQTPASSSAPAQTGSQGLAQAQAHSPAALANLNASIEGLIAKVSPSVVQILVNGYANVNPNPNDASDTILGRDEAIGSGLIIDPSGYIVTNAHVLRGAGRVRVLLPGGVAPINPLESLTAQGQILEAHIIGVADDIDLALIKVEANNLPALPLAHYSQLHQGELVFAFGNPEGLRNSVSMGVISATARQTEPDSPEVYIQTDAPINPGNSGGPLVDISGQVVGVNTFILTQSGGNEGLGFAIPSSIVSVTYQQLRQYGHVHRPQIGVGLETITPTLVAALHLPRQNGLMLSDVVPGSPAESAGLRIGDVVLSVDGTPADNVPYFAFRLMTHTAGDPVQIVVLRGTQRLAVSVPVVIATHPADQMAAMTDPQKNLIRRLGVLGVALTPQLATQLEGLRDPQGIVVVARSADSSADIPLSTGDVIRSVNGAQVTTLEELRSALRALPAGTPVALQVQRGPSLFFIGFTM